jgi:hypothetical protein
VCQRLQTTPKERVLQTIDDLPPGLAGFYARIFRELGQGEAELVEPRMRLLKAMLLAFRPLRIDELQSIMSDDDVETTALSIDLCASFVRRREDSSGFEEFVEFQHQSARDYLASIQSSSEAIPAAFLRYGHADIALNALSFLQDHLVVNILGILRPPSKDELEVAFVKGKSLASLTQLRYAAVFWAQHYRMASLSGLSYAVPSSGTVVVNFLTNKALEWLECLGWLGDLAEGVAALRLIVSFARVSQVGLLDTFARLT